jgi:hypothetical protein
MVHEQVPTQTYFSCNADGDVEKWSFYATIAAAIGLLVFSFSNLT